MEIQRHWRLRGPRIRFRNIFQNPVSKQGMMGAIEDSVNKQNKELKPIRDQIAKEEAEEGLENSEIIVFSSSKLPSYT